MAESQGSSTEDAPAAAAAAPSATATGGFKSNSWTTDYKYKIFYA